MQFDFQPIKDALKSETFDDYRSLRYLKIVHYPSEKTPNAIDLIIDGNDSKLFCLSGIFSPKKDGAQNLKLDFQVTL